MVLSGLLRRLYQESIKYEKEERTEGHETKQAF